MARSRLATALFWLFLALGMTAFPGAAQTAAEAQTTDSALEYQVKAAYLFNFAKYVEWPSGAFAAPDDPIIIGVLGRDPFGSTLEQIIAGRSVGGRRVIVLRSDRPQDFRHCQVLYISPTETGRLPQIIAELSGVPALTVGESPQFLEHGMVRLVIDNRAVRFDVNLENVERAGLKISARMLASARHVYSTARGMPH